MSTSTSTTASTTLAAALEANGFARDRFHLAALRCGGGTFCLALAAGTLLPERVTLAVAVARDCGIAVVGRDGEALLLRATT